MTDQWAPITDDELFGPEPKEAKVVQFPALVLDSKPVEPKPEAPKPKKVPIEKWPKRQPPVYTMQDWEIFNYWVRQKGWSIDMAAQAAGIRVYDALVTLQQRDPYFYEFAVLIGPSGRYSSGSLRRRRGKGLSMGMGGQIKDYERDSSNDTLEGHSARQRGRRVRHESSPPGKLSEEEARARFLALLGDKSEHDRCDGERDTGNLWNNLRTNSAVTKKRRKLVAERRKNRSQKAGKKGGKTVPRCSFCKKTDHNRLTCKALKEYAHQERLKRIRPAGWIEDTQDAEEGRRTGEANHG